MVLVTIVIITYNRPERIPKAIQTVLDQTFQDFEIIVVDGANSIENMDAVLQFKDKRIKYLPVESEFVNANSQVGMQHARNKGCQVVNGKYIAMLDDDDSWMSTKLEKQVMVIEKNPQIALVLCYTKIGIGSNIVINKTKLKPAYDDLLKGFNMSTTSSLLIRAKVLKQIGGWNEKLRGMHEHDIALKIAKKGYTIQTIPEPLMHRETISNHSYFIKIAELVDLWHYYGKDFIHWIGFKGFLINLMKTILLWKLFILGYVIKDRIWKIIYPLDVFYRKNINV